MKDKHHYKILKVPGEDIHQVFARCTECGLVVTIRRSTLRGILLGIRPMPISRYLRVVIFEYEG